MSRSKIENNLSRSLRITWVDQHLRIILRITWVDQNLRLTGVRSNYEIKVTRSETKEKRLELAQNVSIMSINYRI